MYDCTTLVVRYLQSASVIVLCLYRVLTAINDMVGIRLLSAKSHQVCHCCILYTNIHKGHYGLVIVMPCQYHPSLPLYEGTVNTNIIISISSIFRLMPKSINILGSHYLFLTLSRCLSLFLSFSLSNFSKTTCMLIFR